MLTASPPNEIFIEATPWFNTPFSEFLPFLYISLGVIAAVTLVMFLRDVIIKAVYDLRNSANGGNMIAIPSVSNKATQAQWKTWIHRDKPSVSQLMQRKKNAMYYINSHK